jgi:hypothetical protein
MLEHDPATNGILAAISSMGPAMLYDYLRQEFPSLGFLACGMPR